MNEHNTAEVVDIKPEKYTNPNSSLSNIWFQLEKECKAMVKHAFAKGLKVPGSLMEDLEHQLTVFRQQHFSQPGTPQQSEKADINKLTQIHNRLTEVVFPAKPESLLLIAEEAERKPFMYFLGPVPLIRRMMLVAIISLLTLIFLSLSDHINNTSMTKSMFDITGAQLLYVQAILLASAAIGASFESLFRANSYVSACSFDSSFESSYWVRFVVGLISGIILTQLIPIDLNTMASEVGKATNQGSVSQAALRISLALLGGFSANLVYKVLDRLVQTVQGLVAPPRKDDPEALKNTFKNQFDREKQKTVQEILLEMQSLQQQVQLGNADKGDVQQMLVDLQKRISEKHQD